MAPHRAFVVLPPSWRLCELGLLAVMDVILQAKEIHYNLVAITTCWIARNEEAIDLNMEDLTY